MVADNRIPRPKRYLNADAMIASLRSRFGEVPDRRRQASCSYSMTDTITAAFAMFSLKEPSLLSFEERGDEEAIDRLFGIQDVPSDSQMREILDGIEIETLNQAFADLFFELQRGGMLKNWEPNLATTSSYLITSSERATAHVKRLSRLLIPFRGRWSAKHNSFPICR